MNKKELDNKTIDELKELFQKQSKETHQILDKLLGKEENNASIQKN